MSDFWSQHYDGRAFDFEDASCASDIDARNTTASLSKLCRYNGHTKRFYSVAQHTVLGTLAMAVECDAFIVVNTKAHMKCFYVHDTHESAVIDLPTPLKEYLRSLADGMTSLYDYVEEKAARRYRDYYEISPELWSACEGTVKLVDARMLATERRWLLNPSVRKWSAPAAMPYTASSLKLEGNAFRRLFRTSWSPATAAHMFVEVGARLGMRTGLDAESQYDLRARSVAKRLMELAEPLLRRYVGEGK